jgi:hypothetical protein
MVSLSWPGVKVHMDMPAATALATLRELHFDRTGQQVDDLDYLIRWFEQLKPADHAELSDEPTRGHTVLDLKMEALAHAVHLAVKVVESRAMREEPSDFVLAAAKRFERYLTGMASDA